MVENRKIHLLPVEDIPRASMTNLYVYNDNRNGYNEVHRVAA
jgi:hypothetical protein